MKILSTLPLPTLHERGCLVPMSTSPLDKTDAVKQLNRSTLSTTIEAILGLFNMQFTSPNQPGQAWKL